MILSSSASPHLHQQQQHQKPIYRHKPQIIQRYRRPIIKTSPTAMPPLPPRPTPTTTTTKLYASTIKNPTNFNPNSLSDILRKLQDSNHLPQTLTPDNIDNSIRTLVKILNDLKQTQKINENPSQHHLETDVKHHDDDEDIGGGGEVDNDNGDYDYHENGNDDLGSTQPGPNSGRPGIDYPALSEIPQTSFSCKEQRYKGFFGDPETSCQVWHYCDLNGGKASFLCPNGTIFSQVALTCDWWFNVKCSSTAQLYVLNERLYKYILPFTPKFPEDYSGPLVDKYLALKFQEMEEKMRKQKKGKGNNNGEEETDADQEDEDEDEEDDGEEDQEEGNTTAISSIASSPSSSSVQPELQLLEDIQAEPGDELPSNDNDNTPDEEEEDVEKEEDEISINNYTQSTTDDSSRQTTSTLQPNHPTLSHTRTTVESEKVEVIEIKPDGSSGHLIPERDY